MDSRPVKNGLRRKGTFHTCEGVGTFSTCEIIGIFFGILDSVPAGFDAFAKRFFRRSSTAFWMPSATLRRASSISDHVDTGFPSFGKACSLANGVFFQLTGRTMIGMTQALPASCLLIACFNSTLQQYSEEMKSELMSSKMMSALFK